MKIHTLMLPRRLAIQYFWYWRCSNRRPYGLPRYGVRLSSYPSGARKYDITLGRFVACVLFARTL